MIPVTFKRCATTSLIRVIVQHLDTNSKFDTSFDKFRQNKKSLRNPTPNSSNTQLYVYIEKKSLYISRAVSIFYWTEIEIWADFGPVGSIEKKIGPIMSKFWGQFFYVFVGKLFFGKKTS